MVLLKILIPIFFISLSLGEFLKFDLPNHINVAFVDLVILGIVISWFLFVKKSSYKLKLPIVIFLILSIVSLILSIKIFNTSNILIGALYLVRWILYAMLYFVFRDINLKKYKINILLTLTGTIFLVIGYLQYIFYPSLKNLYYQGWDEHMYRLFSSFFDPNFAGTFLVTFLIFVFIYKEKNKFSKRFKYLLNTIIFLTFLSIILTFSRSALLMLGSATVLYAILEKKYKLILILSFLLIFVFIILSPRFYIENMNLLRTPSLEQRILSAKEAVVIFSKNPILGVGFNNYRYAREKYIQKDWAPYPNRAGAGSDNSYAFLLATTGIPGLMVYLFLLYRIIKMNLKVVEKNYYSLILVVSLGGIMFNSLLLNSLFYSFIMIWLWVLVGISENSSRE